MVSHNTYHLISIFLTLDKVYLLMATPLDLEYGVSMVQILSYVFSSVEMDLILRIL